MKILIKTITCLILLAFAVPMSYADKLNEQAYRAIPTDDAAVAALFEQFFGSELAPHAETWDGRNLALYASSWGKNEARKRVLNERILLISEDGTEMRKLYCTRFENNPAKRVNYREETYRAIIPYVFVSHLIDIVDDEHEKLFVNIVHLNPHTRMWSGISEKTWARRELYPPTTALHAEDEALFASYFPKHKWRHSPPTWDAEKRVLYFAQGKNNAHGAYALNGSLIRVSADGKCCRIATKTLERKGAWICRDRPTARELVMVTPFVFVECFATESTEQLRFYIVQFHPQTSAYAGMRIKEYDFRTLKLLRDRVYMQ